MNPFNNKNSNNNSHNNSHNYSNNNNLLNRLEEFMLTDEKINSFIKKDTVPEKKDTRKNEMKESLNKQQNNFFVPKEKDNLFWIFYIIKNGFSKYEYPNTTSFVNEKAEKFNLIESLRLKKHILKINKIKNIKEDVEDELANKEKIGMKTFIALCAAENINILFIHKRKCFHLLANNLEEGSGSGSGSEVEEGNSAIYHVIHQYDKPERYCYELNTGLEQWNKYKTDFFHWESLEKPMKAISSYKVDELTSVCKQLGLVCDSKKSKKDLYEWILMNL